MFALVCLYFEIDARTPQFFGDFEFESGYIYLIHICVEKICRKASLKSMVLCRKYAFFVIFHTF